MILLSMILLTPSTIPALIEVPLQEAPRLRAPTTSLPKK
jgi:hypothetical protein